MIVKRALLSVMTVCLLVLLAACGNGSGSLYSDDIDNYIASRYQLYDTVSSTSNSADYAKIYIAGNQDITTVANDIKNYKAPTEISELKDNKQILVYDYQFVTLTKSEENPADTMVEVAGEKFVRDNYHPGFFEGYLLGSFVDNLFGNGWRRDRDLSCRQNPNYCYGGYNTSGSFVGKNKVPTIRGDSSSVRGGGPGVGK